MMVWILVIVVELERQNEDIQEVKLVGFGVRFSVRGDGK